VEKYDIATIGGAAGAPRGCWLRFAKLNDIVESARLSQNWPLTPMRWKEALDATHFLLVRELLGFAWN